MDHVTDHSDSVHAKKESSEREERYSATQTTIAELERHELAQAIHESTLESISHQAHESLQDVPETQGTMHLHNVREEANLR